MTTHPARRLWLALEPLHAVTYFAPPCRAAADSVGLKGFWMGYFACRAAPLGPVGAAPVRAAFAGFAPSMVERALPDAWAHASPAACLEARVEGAAGALREAGVDEAALGTAADRLQEAVAALDVTGRPLAAANAALPHDDPDPVRRLWQAATTLREHRGDGHVAALVAAGLSGLEAHVLQAPRTGIGRDRMQAARGWSEHDWAAAEAGLAGRRDEAEAALAAVEARTDDVAWAGGLSTIGEPGVDQLVDLLAPSVAAVHAAGWITYPNPMGLPAPAP